MGGVEKYKPKVKDNIAAQSSREPSFLLDGLYVIINCRTVIFYVKMKISSHYDVSCRLGLINVIREIGDLMMLTSSNFDTWCSFALKIDKIEILTNEGN